MAEEGRTRTGALQRAVAALQKVKARLLGVALNKVHARPGSYYYDYYYYYGDDGRGDKKRQRRSGRERMTGRDPAPVRGAAGSAKR